MVGSETIAKHSVPINFLKMCRPYVCKLRRGCLDSFALNKQRREPDFYCTTMPYMLAVVVKHFRFSTRSSLHKYTLNSLQQAMAAYGVEEIRSRKVTMREKEKVLRHKSFYHLSHIYLLHTEVTQP